MNLKEIRIKKNLTQKQAAEQIGICRNAFMAWEKGKATPRDLNMPKLLEWVKPYQLEEGGFPDGNIH